MTTDPRAALSALVAALETHLEMAADRRREDDPNVVSAYQRIADAFVAYDDALLEAYGEVTPLDIYSDDDEEDDDELDELDDDLDDEDDEDDEDDLDIIDLDDDEDDEDDEDDDEDGQDRPS